MRIRGKIVAVLSALCMSAVLSACSFSFSIGGNKFDADEYVKATLDSMYLGEHDKYIEYTKMTEEEAEDQHNRLIAAKADDFLAECEITSISDDVRSDLEDLFEEIYKNVRYEVVEAEKNGDDFTVEVVVSPSEVFSANGDELEDALMDFLYNADYYSYTEEQEVYDDLMTVVINSAEGWLDDISYGSEVSIMVDVVEISKNQYNIDSDDLIQVNDYLVDD